MSDIPSNWQKIPLLNLCDRIVDGSHNPPKATEIGKPMLSARNIQHRKILFDEYRYISEEAFLIEHQRTQVKSNDVLLTIVGTIGRVAIVQEDTPKLSLQRSVAVLKPNDAITPRFLAYALESPRIQKHFIDNAKGTAQKGIYLKALGSLDVEVAPKSEQKRIADKLDAVLARVDACRDRLDRIPAILKRFRQSVLAAATSGELTREWREVNSKKITDASLLLEQILKNRRTIWDENEIRKFESKGKMPSGESWKNKYKIPVSLEIEDRAELPEKWLWTSIDSVSTLVTDGKHGDCNDEHGSGYFFLSAKNIIDGKLVYKNARQIIKSEFDEVHFRTNLEPGDICLVNTGATVGKVAIADDNNLTKRTTFQKSVAVIKLVRPLVSEQYFYFFLMGETKRLLKNSTGSAVNNLLLSAIKEFPVPLPPGDEQKEIVCRVESLFAYADRLEARYKTARAQVEKLTPALLAKAFRGELVPQDPNDEPASELLARIAATKPKNEPTNRSGRNAKASISVAVSKTNES